MIKARLFVIFLSVFTLSLGIALTISAQGIPPNWAQVNISGFGGSANVAVYSLESFNGLLYAGTVNYDSGAQIWRRIGFGWSPVITNGFGSTNTIAINHLLPFGSSLYAATVDAVSGGEVFRSSSDGLNWTRVVTMGFGNPAVNSEVFGFAVLTNTLYAGTICYSNTTGAEIWKTTDGLSWTRAVTNGFGDPGNKAMYSFEKFNGYLYAGTGNSAGSEVWRTTGASWDPVNTTGFSNTNNIGVSALTAFNGYLYAGTRNLTQGGELWRSDNGLNWTPVFTGGLGNAFNGRLYGLIVFDNHLMAVFTNLVTGAEVWRSANGTTWERLMDQGWGDSNNQYADYFNKGAAILYDGLYIGVANFNGAQIWLYRPQVNTLYVAPGGACGGVSPCYATIQSAVDAAADLDEIKVATGVYTDMNVRPRNDAVSTGIVTQVVYISKTVTIAGGFTISNWLTSDPVVHPTTLDAHGKGRVFYIMGEINPTIEGLRITGGATDEKGGGVDIWHARAMVRNNVVYSNTASFGGGIATWESGNHRLIGTTIAENTIVSNTAEDGGGVAMGFDAVIMSDNVIRANIASVIGKQTMRAGGVSVFIGRGTFERNLIQANHTDGYAAGMHVHMGEVTLINNVVTDNRLDDSSELNGGVSFESSTARLMHNTVARNTGDNGGNGITIAGQYGPTTVYITNTILVSQSIGISASGRSTVTVDGVLWNSTPITVSKDAIASVIVRHQYTGNPLFSTDGYHLLWNSAAIDKGLNAGVTDDIDRQLRPKGLGPDLGADEYYPREVYLPIVRKP